MKKARKRALCVGINEYLFGANSRLNGCINDAHVWAALLCEKYDFSRPDVKMLLESEATKQNILRALEDLLAGAQPGDTLVFTNSSHGSYVAEKIDDFTINYDQILCPYDTASNFIRDDELRELIANVGDGVNLTVILDNCFSGTATRVIVGDDIRRRFLSPGFLTEASAVFKHIEVLEEFPLSHWRSVFQANKKITYPEENMREILLTGCSDMEYSYDARFDLVYHGAMTFYATQVLKEANYRLTYAELHARLTDKINASPFRQTPQLEGSMANKNKQVFI